MHWQIGSWAGSYLRPSGWTAGRVRTIR